MIEDGIPIGLVISVDLRQMCLSLFCDLKEFKDPESLITFVRNNHLTIVLRHLPRQAELILDKVIDRLMEWGKSPQRPALLELIIELEKTYQGEHQAEECKNCRKSLESWLVSAPRFDQVHDYEALVTTTPKQAPRVSKSAEQWIDECGTDLDELALRITLCVFNGTTFEVIENAKNRLLALLQETHKSSAGSTATAPPPVSVMRRLMKAGAEESDARPPDWKRVILLNKPAIATEALTYVWRMNRETEWRKNFITWLTEHAEENNPADVRMRAGIAAGRLALKDYGYVRDHLFKRWVKINTRALRMALGMALGVVAREETLTSEVQRQLLIWSHSDRLDERWAAMRAYIFAGAFVKPTSEVMTAWRHIYNSEPAVVQVELGGYTFQGPNPLHMSLVDAIMRFFVVVSELPPKQRESVLSGIVEGLNNWVFARQPDAELGLVSFLLLARLVARSDDKSEAIAAPVLLQQIDPENKQSKYRQQLTQFLANGFRSTSIIRQTNEVICEWLKWINELPAASGPYEQRIHALMADLIASDSTQRMTGKLMSCLRSCRAKGSVDRAAAFLKSM